MSSSSLHEIVVPESSTSTPDGYEIFQDLLRRIVNTLELPTEAVQKKSHKLLAMLHRSILGCLAMPIADGVC